jgi:hypothetical protein
MTIRRSRPGYTVELGGGRRPLRGRGGVAELDDVPVAVVAVDGSAFADDPVARARHAVRVLLSIGATSSVTPADVLTPEILALVPAAILGSAAKSASGVPGRNKTCAASVIPGKP